MAASTQHVVKRDLRALANPSKRDFFPTFFQAHPGGYGEGDRFLGVTVPNMRTVAKRHKELPTRDIEALLHSPWHEERFCALVIMTLQFPKGTEAQKKALYAMYLRNTTHINNWDLVDVSAAMIVGGYLEQRDAAGW